MHAYYARMCTTHGAHTSPLAASLQTGTSTMSSLRLIRPDPKPHPLRGRNSLPQLPVPISDEHLAILEQFAQAVDIPAAEFAGQILAAILTRVADPAEGSAAQQPASPPQGISPEDDVPPIPDE